MLHHSHLFFRNIVYRVILSNFKLQNPDSTSLTRYIFLRMKRLFYFLFLIALHGKAQVNTDSLLKVWNNTRMPDSIRLRAMNRVSFDGYLFSKPDSAFYFAQLELDLATQKGLRKFQAQALNTQGASFYVQGDYKKAIAYYLRSLNILEQTSDKANIASTLGNIGVVYKEQGDYAKAIDYLTRGLKLTEELNDKEGIASAYNNIGNIYLAQEEFSKAFDHYSRALEIEKKIGYKSGMTTSLNNLGIICRKKGQARSAIDYYQQCLKLEEEAGDKQGLSQAFSNIGLAYQELGDVEKAIEYENLSLKAAQESDYKEVMSVALINLSNIYNGKGDYKRAIEYGERALALAKKTGLVYEIQDASKNLSDCYFKTGRYKEALNMHLLYIEMRDSIKSDENQKQVITHELQYKFEKQKALDEKEHEKELAISASEKQKQRVIIFSIVIVLVLLTVFVFFVFNRLRITKRQKSEIQTQKQLIEEKQREIIDSINYAKRLQEAILPPASFISKHLPQSFLLYEPKDIVAGDFYWMHVLEPRDKSQETSRSDLCSDVLNLDSTIYIAAADSTGHGVPGAMVSVVCSNALNRAVKEFGLRDTGKILDKTRELVLETFDKSSSDVRDGMDISLLAIQPPSPLEKDGSLPAGQAGMRTLKWSGANNPLWYTVNGEMKEITADKQAIGKTENSKPFTTHTIQLQTGDSIFLFTDGYADQFGGPKGKKFMYKPLKQLLLKNSSLPPSEQKQSLEDTMNEWKSGLEQIDDICIIGIKI